MILRMKKSDFRRDNQKENKMSEEKIYDITIIGGGPVGLWAAFFMLDYVA